MNPWHGVFAWIMYGCIVIAACSVIYAVWLAILE